MEAKDAIDVKLIDTHLSVKTKEEALRVLSGLMFQENKISDQEAFIKDVYERETQGQTGIGNFVAIPHGKSPFVTVPAVAIGINDREIPWESLDGKGVRAVILFAVGSDAKAAREHLKLLALFAKKLGSDQVVARLLQAESPEDVLTAFSS
ncbi:PTS sugar transporter subunit IIA [Streptococcus devriesei]|uniref:PTS sugar transporter subunit IIA n=1 Tax=Streptococcus devriesei TaxID=231233 RepID=UPI000405247E|nr:fructose PTS transporter subunit IIA [Streptococcus devriesei]